MQIADTKFNRPKPIKSCSSSRSSLEIFDDFYTVGCTVGLWEVLGCHVRPQRLKYCRFKVSDQPIINILTRVWWSSHISFYKYKLEKCTSFIKSEKYPVKQPQGLTLKDIQADDIINTKLNATNFIAEKRIPV